MRLPLLSTLLAATFFGAAGAEGAAQSNSDIAIDHAWSRPSIGASTAGVVYLTVTDKGAPDRLTGASTPIASKAQLHRTTSMGGMAEMRAVSDIPLSAAQPIVLAPNGYHLMLTGLKHPLTPGERFQLTLTFAQAGPVSTTVTVEAMPGAPGAGAMPGMNMGGMH